MKRIVFYLLLIGSLSASATIVFLWQALLNETNKSALFDINKGDSIGRLAERLSVEELLPVDPIIFKLGALLTRHHGFIQAGQYEVTTGMSALDILALFRSGRVVQHKITFVEGITLKQWREQIRSANYLYHDTTMDTNGELALRLGVETSLEGWLFPDTYYYVKGDSELALFQLALSKMHSVLKENWQGQSADSVLASPYAALTLASIIEKETGYEPDRAMIASVFHNRLADGMRLQSDPTVIYGLGEQFTGDLKQSHLRTDSSHNTYTRHGLPLTPICSPGLASIQAATTYTRSPYLYFVAKGDGESHFSTTLDEHNQAVDRYQRGISR